MALRFAAAKLIRDKKSDQDQKKRSIASSCQSYRTKERNTDGSSSSLNSIGGKSCNSGSKSRKPSRCVKRIKGKNGKPDSVDLLVQIDRDIYKLKDEAILDYKEVFMLFDRDVDGVLSLAECSTALHTLGYRLTEKELLERVSNVTEDELNLTVEFNEFLMMMSSSVDKDHLKMDKLVEAFKTFDKSNSGFISKEDFQKLMKSKLSRKDLDELIVEADKDKSGKIDYRAFCSLLCPEIKQEKLKTDRKNKNASGSHGLDEDLIWDDFEAELPSDNLSLKTLNKG